MEVPTVFSGLFHYTSLPQDVGGEHVAARLLTDGDGDHAR